MTIKKHQFASDSERGEGLAKQVATKINQLLKKQLTVTLAVSGGSTPKHFFQTLSKKNVDWEKVTIILVDERCVFETNVDSNMALIKSQLIQNKAKAAKLINYLEVSELHDPGMSEKYANRFFQQPDIVVLGMGEDGHTASLFPEARALHHALNVAPCFVAITPPKGKHLRISLSLSAILAAKLCYLECGGENKLKVLEEAEKEKTQALPISLIIHSEQTLNAYLS